MSMCFYIFTCFDNLYRAILYILTCKVCMGQVCPSLVHFNAEGIFGREMIDCYIF